jgi:4-hydroxybenzoate polyprenyltransferase
MMPVPGHALVAALTYLGIAAFGAHVHGLPPALLSCSTVVGAWSVFSVFLILRLMDELKDRDIDRELFPERPLPSGRVRESDIRITLTAVITAFLAANLFAGRAFWTALLVLGYALLMFRLFFIPDLLRRSLLLSLATHTPIVPLLLLHGFAVFSAGRGLPAAGLAWRRIIPYTVMIWAVYAAWEITKKTRRRDDETRYVTYSKILGPAGAVALAGALQALTSGIAVYFFLALDLSATYVAVIVGAAGLMLWAHGRFLAGATPLPRPLRHYAEIFALAVLAAQVVEFGWLHAA